MEGSLMNADQGSEPVRLGRINPAANARSESAAQPSFAPVQYALRNVFIVPGAQ